MLELRMRGVVVGLMILLAGCTLRETKQAAAPPPPKPAPVKAEPEPPLSVPQTNVQLPSPQPVNPDAIVPVPAESPAVTEKAEETAPAPRPARRQASPQRSEVEPPAAAAPPAGEAPEESPTTLQPMLSPQEQKRLQESIEARRREVAELLKKAERRSSEQNKAVEERIQSFLSLSEKAAQRGDYTQADALSERALILARELQVE